MPTKQRQCQAIAKDKAKLAKVKPDNVIPVPPQAQRTPDHNNITQWLQARRAESDAKREETPQQRREAYQRWLAEWEKK